MPHSVYPAGYHCDPKQPLPFAALASQKNYMSLYLMSVYCGSGGLDDPATVHANWFHEEWAKTGKKLDMGKSCIRFKKLEDFALDVIAQLFRRTPVEKFIKHYESVIKEAGSRKPVAKQASKPAKKAPAKKAKAK